MNAELTHPRMRLIEIGKQHRGTWILAGLDLLIVLGLWAAAAYNPGVPRLVTADPSSRAQTILAVNAQAAAAQPIAAPLLRSNYTVASSHGAACNALPAGCGGNIQARTSDTTAACQPVSRAAQHRDGDMANPNPCTGAP